MNTLLDTAMYWLDMQIPPIPVAPRSKIPLVKWKRYVDDLPKKELVEFWFKEEKNNIALVCGSIAKLSIIDFDKIPMWHKWKRKMVKEDCTWSGIEDKTYFVRTSRGIHLYFITDSPEQTRHNSEYKIDVKGNNSIVIAPPSIHPSGTHYYATNAIKPLKIDHIPVIGDCIDTAIYQCSNVPEYIPDYPSIEDTPIQKIKKVVYIADIIQRFTTLKKTAQDGKYWIGTCPLHDDKHPSLSVNLATNKCKCFSTDCRLGDRWRDSIDLCVELYGLDKKTIVKNLIEEYNII